MVLLDPSNLVKDLNNLVNALSSQVKNTKNRAEAFSSRVRDHMAPKHRVAKVKAAAKEARVVVPTK